MPYIKKEFRDKYNETIKEAISSIVAGAETLLVKGEYFGYVVNRIIRSFMGTMDYTQGTFNSHLFGGPKTKALMTYADKLGSLISKGDPLQAAGEMNYVISSILWGIMGSAKNIDEAAYGFRAYLKGVCTQILNELENAKFSSVADAKDRVMSYRRFLVAQGVLGDVLDEVYRRNTSKYEDKKLKENGDIWINEDLIGIEKEND